MAEPVGPQPPAWARAAFVGLAVGAYAAAGAQATESLSSGEPWNWGGMLARWAGYAVLGAVLDGLTRSGVFLSPDQRDGRAVVAAALRTGELADGATPDAWRAVLVLSQLVAVAAVVENDSAPGLWALALALAAFVVVPLGWLGGRRRRVRALLAQLDAA